MSDEAGKPLYRIAQGWEIASAKLVRWEDGKPVGEVTDLPSPQATMLKKPDVAQDAVFNFTDLGTFDVLTGTSTVPISGWRMPDVRITWEFEAMTYEQMWRFLRFLFGPAPYRHRLRELERRETRRCRRLIRGF